MGKSMAKSKVIWGEKRSVSLASFSNTHFQEIFKLIRENIGPGEYVNEAGIRRAVMQAKQNPKMKNGYVKLGLIGSDLVIRAKEKKFLGDIEIDAVAVKSYPVKVKKYAPIKRQLELQKIKDEMDKLEKQRKGRDHLKGAQRGSGEVVPVIKPTLRRSGEKPPLPKGPKPTPPKVMPESTLVTTAPTIVPQSVPPPLTRQLSRREQEQQERETEELRAELDRLAREAEELRKQKLRNVMGRKDDEGVSLRDRLLRAANKAQMLGIGDYAKEKLKTQGLTPMHVDYHGEVLDHQKNRYGRYLKPLWDVYQKSDPKMNFSRWLDGVEARQVGLPGLEEALGLTSPEIRGGGGKVVQPEGVQGGRVVYLDAEQRKPYEAKITKGNLTGGVLEPKGEGPIFVIGSDNKLYVGTKQRARPGVKGAFNHSSFFSGGPVKAAGSLVLSGSRVSGITDVSGHYTPSTEMIRNVVRRFAGGDQDWLNEVLVWIKGKSSTGKFFMEAEAKRQAEATWGKYSAGALTKARAGRLLTGTEDGSWIVWQNGDEGLFLTHNKGGTVTHVPMAELGAQGLERKKLLSGDKLPKEAGFGAAQVNEMMQSPAWHPNLNTQTTEARLKNEPLNSWLLRPSSQAGVLVLSRVVARSAKLSPFHTRIVDLETYEIYQDHARTHAGLMIRA